MLLRRKDGTRAVGNCAVHSHRLIALCDTIRAPGTREKAPLLELTTEASSLASGDIQERAATHDTGGASRVPYLLSRKCPVEVDIFF